MADSRPRDQETRELVLNPGKSFIVQAPAGSGKTELLVRRYLCLLAVVDAPEEIIAITFTRKAAAEMRERIVGALHTAQGAHTGALPNADQADEKLPHPAAAALARDRELGWRLTRNPARLKIQTIDSFCAALTQQMPLLSELGGQPEIIEDARDLYREAAANTLKLLDEDPAQAGQQGGRSAAVEILLEHLDNDLPRARDMLVSMLQKRDQWLRHLAGQRPDRAALERALRHFVEATLEDTLETLPQELLPVLVDCVRYAAGNRGDAPGEIEQLPGMDAADLQYWQYMASLCLTGTGGWRRRVDVRTGFPAGAAGMDMKGRFQALLHRLSECPRLLELFREIQGLPPVEYSDGDWVVLEALYVLLALANAQLHLLFAARNQVDYTGLSLGALRALETSEGPTDLALYLDYRMRHILVDEYQDVSINQYELLERLTAGWSMEDGHSLFLVGDPMQSIYRFRKAEVGVFLNTWERQRLGQAPVNPVKIEVNFRSDPAVVDWVNSTFPSVLPASADGARGAVSFTPASGFRELPGENDVYIHPILVQDGSRADLREAEQALTLINNIREESEAGSTAILVRSRTHLKSITALLAQHEIPFRAVELEQLNTRPMIQDLLALTRALHHPADRVAWLALLRAPWCGLTLADLLALTEGGDNTAILQSLRDSRLRTRLSADGRCRVERLCGVIDQALARRGRTSLRRWVEGAWLNLGGPATLDMPADLRNADRFFELLDDLDQGGDLRDPEELERRVDELYAGADTRADDTLQVMSIHSAKGLEFDHVILPGLSRRLRSDEPQLLLWSENPYPEGSDLLLAPVKASDEDTSPIYEFIRRLEKQKQHHEEGRLLYVAVTRTRKQLHLIGSVKVKTEDGPPSLAPPPDNTLLAQLWPALEQDFQACLDSQHPQSVMDSPPVETQDALLRRLRAEWQLPESPPGLQWTPSWPADADPAETAPEDGRIEYLWAGRTLMHTGTVVHRCLQLMSEEGTGSWDPGTISAQRPWYRESLYALGVPEAELDRACAWVEQALDGILEDPRGRWLLARREEQESEYALSGIYGGKLTNIIIDRTFVDEKGVRWIIDYKTSRHESGDVDRFLDLQQERYRGQLERYAAIMSALDDRPIRLGLYFPLLRGWREWAFSS